MYHVTQVSIMLYYTNILHHASLPLLQLQLFQDRLHSVIATRIDSDCNGCGFTSNYLGNWFVSCHNDTAIYYHAVIKDSWTSSQYPANALLELIRQRYGIIYTFEISTNDMPAIENEEESFVLNSESVGITCRMSVNEMDMTSGGSGIGDSEDECSFTTISVSNNTGTAINDTTTAMDMDTEGSSNGTDEIVIVVTMDPDAGSILDGAEMARGVPMVTIICAVLALSMSHWRALAH